MKLKVGDLVAFKKYENMTDEEQVGISRGKFPEFGEVEKVFNFTENIKIKGSSYIFPKKSIDYVIVKAATDDIHVGDEVLVKATVGEVKENYIWTSWISKDDVVKVLKRKEERFIVQEDHYGMYVTDSKTLSLDKSKAKIYDSRNDANDEAADMHLNAWEVINCDA